MKHIFRFLLLSIAAGLLVACGSGGDAIDSQQIVLKVKAVTLHEQCSFTGCADVVISMANQAYEVGSLGPVFIVGHCYQVWVHGNIAGPQIETDQPIIESNCP